MQDVETLADHLAEQMALALVLYPALPQAMARMREEAAKLYARILPLINYENRQCGLRATKAMMAEGGVIRHETVRHPLEPLHPQTRAGLLELAREVDPLVLRWGR